MAQYDVYGDSSGGERFLDLQSDFLPHRRSRVVAPLFKLDEAPEPTDRLTPVLEVDGARYVLAVHLLAAVPTAQLPPAIANLGDEAYAITGALDLLFHGF